MSPTNVEFRIATLDDAPRIQDLVESAFRAEDSRPGWTADMILGRGFSFSVAQVVTQITKPDGAILVAFNDSGSLVGSVEVTKRSDMGRISMLSVDTHQQQAGLGRKVLAHAEDYCQKTWGVTKLGLDALSTRKLLIGWYERNGYKKTGETRPFPVKEVDGVALEHDLCFVELEKEVK